MTMKRNISTGFLMLLLIIFSPMASLQWMGSTPVEAYRSVKETEYDVRIYQADPPLKKLMGDIDGDGLIDIPMKYRGDGIYIKFGKSIEYGRTYNATEDYDFAIIGNGTQIYLRLKYIIDLNNDLYDDLIVNTLYSPDGGATWDSRLRILYGRVNYPKVIYLEENGNSSYWNATISGPYDPSGGFADYVEIFDYDNDGLNDIFPSNPGLIVSPDEKGVIYGISGRVLKSKKEVRYGDFDFTIIGKKYDNDVQNLGHGLYSIDFDGDGNEDWVWSDVFLSPPGRTGAGLTMIIFNNGTRLHGNYTLEDFDTTVIYGAESRDFAGMDGDYGLAKGDFNYDGIEDLVLNIVGSDGPDNSVTDCGEISIILGNRTRESVIDLRSNRNRVYFTIYGSMAGEQIGHAVDVADYNNDSYPDLLFSSRVSITAAYSGAAFVWLGKKNPAREYYSLRDSEVGFEGVNLEIMADYGFAVVFEDMNGDGFPDVIVSPKPNPYKGKYTDIFLNKNDPPTVRFLGVEKKEVLRGEENHLWVLCY
ncbi:MAG: hypothetical protein DRN55_09235, partial [Thermoplasmata archaeon]